MGEIGAMVARLEQEGLDLEQLIDCELEAAGFLSLTARSTDSLSDRADAISGNQSELKTLLKSIEDQLRTVQTEENIPENLLDDKSFIDDNKEVKHIIVIEDDEDMEKGGSACQASMEPRPSPVTKATTVLSTSSVSQTTTTTTTKLTTPTASTADSTTVSPNKKAPFTPKGQVTKTIPILPKLITTSSKTMPKGPGTPEGVIAYRTLKSPVDAGPATVSMVTLKSSQPVVPPQHVRGVITSPTMPIGPQSVVSVTSATKPVPTQQVRTTTTPTLPIPSTQVRAAAMPTTFVPPPPQHVRGATTPTTPSASTIAATSVTQTPSSTQATATVVNEVTTPVPIRPSPPKFEETTRIIGKRVDDLWYPGEIVKVISDRFNQVKIRVKFDQGNRGLLRTNQIALESCPPKFILDIGSRVVALRPRETADESASWRQAKEGPYGKLDVLYAGIVAEKSCPQTKHRFLIFFDDGFAQYLPLQKLHHVYHTGDKVWNEVAEHSQEFIQEYLEEFPNRPMVVLKTHQWVKTEWRGKWLKARVLEVDCSLVKMLFQVDNRTEWIYRGSTRLEPLYKALVHGKISRKKNKRQRKPPIDSQEPYVDFNATGPEFGFSLYSKTNTTGQQTPIPPPPQQPPQQERETNSDQSVAQGQPKESKSLSTSVATTTMQGQSTSTTTQLNTSTPTNTIIQTQPTITTTTNNTTHTSTPSGTNQAQPFTKQATLGTATSQTSSTPLMGTTSSAPLMGSTSSMPLMGSTAKSIANFNTLRRLATRLNKNTAMSNAGSSTGSMSSSSTTVTGSMSPSSTTITGSMPISGGTSTGSVPTSSSTSTGSMPTSNTRSMSTTITTITGSMPTTSSISMGSKSTSGSTSTGSMSTTITTITGSMPTTITTITGSMPTTSSISMGTMSTSGSTSRGSMPTSSSTSTGRVPTSITGSMPTSITTSTGSMPTSITTSTGSMPTSITTSTGSMPTSITASTGRVPSVGERNSAARQQTTNTVKILSESQTSLSSSSLGEQRNNGRIVSQSVPAISSSTCDSIINTNWSSSKYDGSTVSHFSQIHHLDTASIIKASTMRKRTTAGLAPNKSHVRMLDMNSDRTLVFPGVSNGDIQTVRSSPIKMWDAPWKRNNHTNKISLKDQGLKIKVDLKHDPAALIQEHLQAQKKLVRTLKVMPELQPLIPKPPVLGPHKCGRQCGQIQQVNKKEKSKHNVFALPLLVNWKREITQRHPRSKKEIYYRAPCNKRLRSIEDVGKYLTLVGTTNVAIDQFSFDSEITCSDVLISSDNILLADISYGEELISISVANEHDSSLPPPIDYVSDRVLSDGVQINTDPGFLACCDCTDNCQDKTKCSCAQLTISASAAVDGKVDNTVGYEYRRLMDCVPTGIYECNQNCACSLQCFNRVVQNGIQLRLQVFKTENRGWGLRTLDDIPMGTFICTYSGQIMNEDMANKEGRDYGDEYLAELDHMEVVEKIKEGYESSVSDLEDDSVLLKTLETGHSTTDFSDNGSVAGSNISDSESSDSDSSHSSDSYIPRKKDRKLTRKSSFDDTVKITEEDGTSFSVTMADEKCLMATSSGKSIVLRRISASGDVTVVEEEQTVVQQEKTQPVDAPPQKDPPPMSQPTIIDLTSDDEDSLMTNCASDKASDQTFDSSKNVDNKMTLSNDTNNLSTANELGKTDITVKHSAPGSNFQPFTDFKLIEISSSDADVTDDGSRDNSDVTGGSHCNSDATPDLEKNASKSDNCINNASKDDSEQSVKEGTSDGKIEEDEKRDGEQNDPMELESAVQSIVLQDRAASPMEINGDASSTTPNQVTSSVTEVTKQETMDTDPCLREHPQKPNDEMNNSSNIIRNENSCQGESCHGNQNSSHSNINNSQGGNSHGNEESSPSDINHSNESSSQGDGCPDNKDNSSDNNELDDDKHHHSSDSGQQQDVSKCNGDETSSHSNDRTSDVMGSSHGDKSDVTDESDYNNGKNSDVVDSCHGDTNDVADGFHSDTRNIDSKDSAKDEMMDNYESSGGHHVDFELRMEIDDETEFLEENEPEDVQDDQLSNTSVSSTKNQPSEVSSDGVPPLMSADDLSRLAAQIHQADEEPPKLTKMQSGSRVTADLHDTIAKLQSRGVALDSISPEKNEDSTQSFEDLPLFPSTNNCDVESFPPSPASSHSDSSVSDSLERSSDESYERSKRRERRVNDGRRARRFIVTLQKSGIKRSASPDGMDGGPYKRPSTRCLFDGEEHCYVIDAKAYGNCGRYLNHSCSPNLFVQNVFIDTHDLRFPRVAFFAQHNISAGSELTWDYMYEVGSVQDKVLRCYCGSSQCRGRLL